MKILYSITITMFTKYNNILSFHTFTSIHCLFHYVGPITQIMNYDRQLYHRGTDMKTIESMQDFRP